MHILIADDDPACLMTLRVMLHHLGHTVKEASNGQELLNAFTRASREHDAIIADCMMPAMNGLEAIREIKKISKIPCVILTALDHGTTIFDSNGKYVAWTNADFYLGKPLTICALKETVRNIHETHARTISPRSRQASGRTRAVRQVSHNTGVHL